MGVPTSEVGYTPAMPRRVDHEVHQGPVVALGERKKKKKKKKKTILYYLYRASFIIFIITNKSTINIITVYTTAMYNLYSYTFR
jgi:hypothetical protein